MISGIIFQNRTSPGGGFNPIKKYESKWESSQIFGVKMKNSQNDHLDPSIDTNVITFLSHDWSCFFILEIQVFETFSRFPLWLTSGLSVLCFGSPWETHSL